MAEDGASSKNSRRLVGYENFVRHNPFSDRFDIKSFHHIEFYSADATSTCKRCAPIFVQVMKALKCLTLWVDLSVECCRLLTGLGMTLVAKSDTGSGNTACTSFVIQSNDLKFVITAPQMVSAVRSVGKCPLPGYDAEKAFAFIKEHGLAVKSIGETTDTLRLSKSVDPIKCHTLPCWPRNHR
jgi:4-hydroxyphenylpyruvate dioxygenase